MKLKSGEIDRAKFEREILVGEIDDVFGKKVDPANLRNRSNDKITVFESLGIALQDLKSVRAVLEGDARRE